MDNKPKNVLTLREALTIAEKGKFALGSFSPRYTPVIHPVLQAGQQLDSPLIVQISQKELIRYDISPQEFAEEFYKVIAEDKIQIPVVLHLDHTKDFSVIEQAIGAGFTSVMIDASEKDFEENVQITKEVVHYAHHHGVSVEAELGRIGTTDFLETDSDEELYTDPQEAAEFVKRTGVDALAVSVGTAHGVYKVKEPKVDFARIEAIDGLTEAFLVLHGGSGVPSWMVKQAIEIGVRKVNIATDLEIGLLQALGREERMLNIELCALDAAELCRGQKAVAEIVKEKITNFLGSRDQAKRFHFCQA